MNKLYHKEYYIKNRIKKLEYRKLYTKNNKEKISKFKKLFWQKNKEKIKLKTKSYREKNSEKIKLQKRLYYYKNKEKIRIKQNKKYALNKEAIKIQRKEYRLKNRKPSKPQLSIEQRTENRKIYTKNYKEINKNRIREYVLKNKEHIRQYQKEYRKKNAKKIQKQRKIKKETNPMFRLAYSLRNRLLVYLKINNLTKKYKYNEYIGCKPIFLKEYIESKFQPGMNWDNHGRSGWHIDHIIPLSSANNEEELFTLCHYTNLQPLWAIDNLKKGDKIIKQESLCLNLLK